MYLFRKSNEKKVILFAKKFRKGLHLSGVEPII